MDQSRSYHSVGSNDREVCDCRSIFTDVTDQVLSVFAEEGKERILKGRILRCVSEEVGIL